MFYGCIVCLMFLFFLIYFLLTPQQFRLRGEILGLQEFSENPWLLLS